MYNSIDLAHIGGLGLKMRLRRSVCLRANLLIPALLLASAWQAQAIHFTVSQTGPPVWQYTLTYDPLDNYSIFQSPSAITVTGLTGVTAVGIPTSTDFPPAFSASQLMWTAQVSNGGTTVVWTNNGGGTGNFSTAQHVYGFSITAPNAGNGTVSFATSGFSRDRGNPLPGGGFSVDISGQVAGPVPGSPAVPAMSSLALLLTMLGLACVAAYQARTRLLERFQNRS